MNTSIVRRYLAPLSIWLPTAIVGGMLVARGNALDFERGVVLIGIPLLLAWLLSIPVWWYCSTHDWPLRVRPSFYAAHFVVGTAFSAAWVLGQYVLNPYRSRSVLGALAMSRPLSWQFLTGAWLYGMIAGVAYAIRARRQENETSKRAAEAEAMAVRANLEALQARLNPHFLFNALHTIGELARSDARAVPAAVEELGDLLRYTLRPTDSDLVSVEEELEFTTKYIGFERLRFEDRLRYHSRVDPAALSQRVPRFAVQTLVENALRHSIARRSEGGEVWLTAANDGATVRISVRDDGASTQGAGKSESATGFGLAALRARLAAGFGARASLTVQESVSGGHEVTICVPVSAASSGVA